MPTDEDGISRDPSATVVASDGQVFPDPYGPAADDDSRSAETAEAFADLLACAQLAAFRRRVTELNAEGRERPPVRAGGREFFTRRDAGSPYTRLLARDQAGERVLVEDLRPSLVYPDVYPDGWWPSPDGGLVAYVQDASATEDQAVLHIVPASTNEDGPASLFQVAGARRAGFAWVGADFVCSIEDPATLSQHLRLYRARGDGTYEPGPLPDPRTGLPRSRYELFGVPGSRTVVVSGSDHGLHQPNSVTTLNVDSGELRTVQPETDAFTRIQVDPNGRWGYLLEHSGDGPGRGALWRVRLDDDGPLTRDRWQQVVPEHDTAVLRQFCLLHRSAGREPVVALHERVHGVSRLAMVDVSDGRRWPVPLAGTAVEGGDGVHGVFSALTAARDRTGTPLLYVEHHSTANPPRVWAVAAVPGTAPVLVRGRSDAELAAAGFPQVTARLHHFAAHDARRTPTWGISFTARDPTGPRPVVLEVYNGFFLAGENLQSYSAASAALLDAGVTIFAPFPRDGSEGRQDQRAGATVNRGNAAAAVTAAGHYARQHLAGDHPMVLTAGSQGPLIALMAVRADPELFDAAIMSRGASDLLSGSAAESTAEYFGGGSPEEVAAAYRDSAGYHEQPGTPFPLTVFVADDRDPRVPARGPRKAHAAMNDTTSDGEIHLATASVGHFTGPDQQAERAALTAYLAQAPNQRFARPENAAPPAVVERRMAEVGRGHPQGDAPRPEHLASETVTGPVARPGTAAGGPGARYRNDPVTVPATRPAPQPEPPAESTAVTPPHTGPPDRPSLFNRSRQHPAHKAPAAAERPRPGPHVTPGRGIGLEQNL
ncbi:prolyl oligopeptidase family serine peptidase [Streptodolium elevatio]|uniref:Prolyl oligopeptidase family serine peptidase n=1 Tax=Streptodolium elevatio TaxID=3157996 RepID=A0ABV3DWM3_9ACTN